MYRYPLVVHDLLCVEQSIVSIAESVFSYEIADWVCSVFEYTYLLFWNSFWTILPVIAMGLFDRIADDHVLMDLPELYKHSRLGEYFNLKLFLVYMVDGAYQVCIISLLTASMY